MLPTILRGGRRACSLSYSSFSSASTAPAAATHANIPSTLRRSVAVASPVRLPLPVGRRWMCTDPHAGRRITDEDTDPMLMELNKHLKYPEAEAAADAFVFSSDNFVDPQLPSGLAIKDVPLVRATDESLE